MGTHSIKNVPNPVDPQDAGTKAYVGDRLSSGRILQLGGSMRDHKDMGIHGIKNVANPVNPQDATIKAYVGRLKQMCITT